MRGSLRHLNWVRKTFVGRRFSYLTDVGLYELVSIDVVYNVAVNGELCPGPLCALNFIHFDGEQKSWTLPFLTTILSVHLRMRCVYLTDEKYGEFPWPEPEWLG
jgi:hypothetical protein